MQVPRESRSVVAVVPHDWWQQRLAIRIQVEPFLSRVTRNVRQEETHRHEEWFVGRCCELFDRPARDFPVAFVFVFVRKDSPINQRMRGRSLHQFFFRSNSHTRRRTYDVEFGIGLFATVATVVNLARCKSFVAVLLQVLRQGHEILEFVQTSEPRRQPANSGRGWSQAGHQTCPRGVAQRCLAMSIQENGSAGSQLVDVRRLHFRVPAEAANPVVLIINRDEQDVWLFRCANTNRQDQRETQSGKSH